MLLADILHCVRVEEVCTQSRGHFGSSKTVLRGIFRCKQLPRRRVYQATILHRPSARRPLRETAPSLSAGEPDILAVPPHAGYGSPQTFTPPCRQQILGTP